MSFGKMLIHKCEIFRHGDVARGNFTKKEPISIYNTNCRFVRKNTVGMGNTLSNGRIKISAYYILYLPKRVNVKNGDLVAWSLDPHTMYKVQEPYSPSNQFNIVTIEKEGEA